MSINGLCCQSKIMTGSTIWLACYNSNISVMREMNSLLVGQGVEPSGRGGKYLDQMMRSWCSHAAAMALRMECSTERASGTSTRSAMVGYSSFDSRILGFLAKMGMPTHSWR